jgi:DNA replication protein DnaD
MLEVTLINKFSHKELTIFNYLVFNIEKYQGSLFVSQATIAEACATTRETVNRAIDLFTWHNLINKVYRHRKTCLYFLPKRFQSGELRQKLASIVPAFKNALKQAIIKINQLYVTPLYSYKDLRIKSTRIINNNITYNSKKAPIKNISGVPARLGLQSAVDLELEKLNLCYEERNYLWSLPNNALLFALESVRKYKPRDPFAYICKLTNLWLKKNNTSFAKKRIGQPDASQSVIAKEQKIHKQEKQKLSFEEYCQTEHFKTLSALVGKKIAEESYKRVVLQEYNG